MLDLRDKKILVSGGSGFCGTHVVEVLKARGVPIPGQNPTIDSNLTHNSIVP